MSAAKPSPAIPKGTVNSRGPEVYAGPSLIIGLIGIVVGLAGIGVGLGQGESRHVSSWLLGMSFWLSIGIGMMFITAIWYIFDAGWPIVLRRQFEHAMAGIKYLGVLFLPLVAIILFSSQPGILWEWMDPNLELYSGYTVAEDVLYQAKEPYLNVPFFLARAALYFAVFIGLAEFFRRSSFQMDKDGKIAHAKRARVVSALGLPFLAIAATFAAFDWFMSLQFHWFSTMYGVWFFAGAIRSATAVGILIGILLVAAGPLRGLFNQGHRYLLGCMLLAFTVFWAYIAFSQYFLIYNANIPEVTFWYNMRLFSLDGTGLSGWGWVMMSLVFFYFFFPFTVLLFYKTKVIIPRLAFIATWILVFHLVDLYYNIIPRKIPAEVTPEAPLGYTITPLIGDPLSILFDVGAVVGIGGICVWAFLNSMKKTEVIPIRDPRIEDSLNCHE